MCNIINKFMLATVLGVCIAMLVGCKSMNSRFGMDPTYYAEETELPQLKLPPGSMAVSKRYDIPDIPGNKDLIVSNNVPPDFY